MPDGRTKADIRDLAAEAGSLTESAYRNIRADIIAGRCPPGTKLQIDDLKSRYGLSASPLREALARLISHSWAVVCCADRHVAGVDRTPLVEAGDTA